MVLRIKDDYFPIKYLVVDFYDLDEECLLRGTKSVLKFNPLNA